MKKVLLLFKLSLMIFQANCFTENVYGNIKAQPVLEDLGAPLILTPLLKEGKIKEAKEASEVKFNGFKQITSYAAYLTVDDLFHSNLFFWFFPAQKDYTNAPVILWLQGGPGATSLLGLFTENGPFMVKNKHGLKLRQYSWTENHSVLYIDNPVGTGFSFTDEGGYAKNETIIGSQLYTAMLQFYQLFPELQKNNFFISGESYGGKYAPALGYTIYKNNPNAKLKINLQGISIGNGYCDPEHQLRYGEYLYQLGIIDINAREQFTQLEDAIIKYVQDKQWVKASETADMLIGRGNVPTLFKNATDFDNLYNYLNSAVTEDVFEEIGKYVQRSDIRTAIHVGNATFHGYSEAVALHLKEDAIQSVAPWISELLEHYRILIYNGQLDIIVAYPLTLNFLQNLKFKAANEYKSAPRLTWYTDSHLAGYVKQAGNLYEVLVRNAGHMVPTDQPKWALDLITRFTRNKPFHTE